MSSASRCIRLRPASATCAWRRWRTTLREQRSTRQNVTRRQLDSLTLGACDELDARPISSMLMSAPSGGYDTDEIKVTDSGASALCLAFARFMAGESNLGLVMNWCKSSKTDVEAVMRLRGDPFFTRLFGINAAIGDALFAQPVSREFDITQDEVARRVVDAYTRGAANPRGMSHPVLSLAAVNGSALDATPLRALQRAPLSDGAPLDRRQRIAGSLDELIRRR